jgi:putative transcriptional regulator
MSKHILTMDAMSIIIKTKLDTSSIDGGESMRMNLKNLRISSNLSVPVIAKELGISASFYYKIESGVRNPTISLAKNICDIMGGNINEIFFTLRIDETSN